MSRRSGQAGYVVLKGTNYHGRFYEDVPGELKRRRRSLLIGPVKGMTKPEARRKLRTMIEEMGINTSAHLDRSMKLTDTFEQKAKRWEEDTLPLHKLSSQDSTHYIIKKHLIPHFGKLPLDLVNEEAVQGWISVLHKTKLKPKTIQNIYKVLRLVVGRQSKEWIVKLPSVPLTEQRWFTVEEGQKIVEAAEGQYKALFALQFGTGMRIGELAGLHVEDVDLHDNVIHIRRSVFKRIEVTPKTEAGYRHVDIAGPIKEMLKDLIGTKTTGRLFSSMKGTPLNSSNVNRYVLKPICRELKIPIGTTHAFRHGRVSALTEAGVPGELIKKWVGHSSLKITARYTHFSSQFRKDTAARMESILGPVGPSGKKATG